MRVNFDPVALNIFGFSIYWYSLAYVVGIFSCYCGCKYFIKRFNSEITNEQIENFINWEICGIIIGGRVGYVLFYDIDVYLRNLLEIFKIWKGGMSFFGGFIGVSLVTLIFCKRQKIEFLKFCDLLSITVPVGLFCGRIANFINAELLGRQSDVCWAVVFGDNLKRHPSQIYEAIAEGALLLIVMLYFALKTQAYKFSGRITAIFCMGYSFARFCCEFFRLPDSDLSNTMFDLFGVNFNQCLSLLLFLVGVYVYSISYRKFCKTEIEDRYA